MGHGVLNGPNSERMFASRPLNSQKRLNQPDGPAHFRPEWTLANTGVRDRDLHWKRLLWDTSVHVQLLGPMPKSPSRADAKIRYDSTRSRHPHNVATVAQA